MTRNETLVVIDFLFGLVLGLWFIISPNPISLLFGIVVFILGRFYWNPLDKSANED